MINLKKYWKETPKNEETNFKVATASLRHKGYLLRLAGLRQKHPERFKFVPRPRLLTRVDKNPYTGFINDL